MLIWLRSSSSTATVIAVLLVYRAAAVASALWSVSEYRLVDSSSAREALTNDAKRVESRIIGGEEAIPGEFPWYASSSGSPGSGICGATLIHDDIILSAAHCSGQFDQGVLIGHHRFGEITEGAEFHTIDMEIRNADYDIHSQTSSHDAMLSRLTKPSQKETIGFNSNEENPMTGDNLTVMGFGTTEFQGGRSTQLMRTTLLAVDFDTCNAQYANVELEPDVMMCTGFPGGGRDTCQGDSGGPVVTSDGTLVVGIVSFGVGCGLPDFSGVNTRVSGISRWIADQVCRLSLNPPADCPGIADEAPVLRIEIAYDMLPAETTFELKDEGGNVVYAGPEYGPEATDVWITELIGLPENQSYSFTIFDQFCDGFLTFQPVKASFVELYWLENAATKVLLARVDGNFGCNTTKTFILTNSLSVPTTVSPVATAVPSDVPSKVPSVTPVGNPSDQPSAVPTGAPRDVLSNLPSVRFGSNSGPSSVPSVVDMGFGSMVPTRQPSLVSEPTPVTPVDGDEESVRSSHSSGRRTKQWIRVCGKPWWFGAETLVGGMVLLWLGNFAGFG
jgi:trypsin